VISADAQTNRHSTRKSILGPARSALQTSWVHVKCAPSW